jgi:citrate lyase beta subunit
MRRPVHVVYGGAHLFKAEIVRKLGEVAGRVLEQYAPRPEDLAFATGISHELAAVVHPLVLEKLRREPVEDYRIDFEDGYGYRPDAEEDGHAEAASREAVRAVKAGLLPPFFGIRVKPFSPASKKRALRTLDRFLPHFREETGALYPKNFVVTLPKITSADEVRALVWLLEQIEAAHTGPETKIELMMETPAALRKLREIVSAADGRAVAVHFGPYDYTSSLGITASNQSLNHPACDFARSMMQMELADCDVALADGPTTLLPIAPHRGDALTAQQLRENRETVFAAWNLHFANVRRALGNGFYQGWDLHPAQLPTRYAAVYSFFHEGLADASRRMCNFMDAAAQATRIGAIFDDAATGEGLLNFFVRAVDCGAISADRLPELAGLSKAELETGSFARILEMRRG